MPPLGRDETIPTFFARRTPDSNRVISIRSRVRATPPLVVRYYIPPPFLLPLESPFLYLAAKERAPSAHNPNTAKEFRQIFTNYGEDVFSVKSGALFHFCFSFSLVFFSFSFPSFGSLWRPVLEGRRTPRCFLASPVCIDTRTGEEGGGDGARRVTFHFSAERKKKKGEKHEKTRAIGRVSGSRSAPRPELF